MKPVNALPLFLVIITVITGYYFSFSTSSSNNSDGKSEINSDFKGISWESEKLSEYQLIRPINYSKDAVDAYHLPINKGQWYLINKANECYLLPVYIGFGPDFVESMVKTKFAIIDTMFTGFMSNSKKFNGLQAIHTMEILCFRTKYCVKPSPE